MKFLDIILSINKSTPVEESEYRSVEREYNIEKLLDADSEKVEELQTWLNEHTIKREASIKVSKNRFTSDTGPR